MAHGVNTVLKRCKSDQSVKTGIGSRRIFAPQFKLQVLDSYRNDTDCKGNQRATARKYGIHRRQIQKWLQVESNLRNSIVKTTKTSTVITPEARKCIAALNVVDTPRQRDDTTKLACCQQMVVPTPDQRVPDQHDEMAASVPNCCRQQFVTTSDDWDSYHSVSPLPSPLSLPLDYTTHSRHYETSLPSPPSLHLLETAPIDLSIRKPNNSQIWDLSLKGLKPEILDVTTVTSTTTPPISKPVKLFKPYLDEEEPPKPTYNYYEYDPFYEPLRPVYDYYPNGGLHFVSTFVPEQQSIPLPPCMKQRQSYSLDFKLSAIECYHTDAICRGNQRAVASKFKIHRRQIQKWLKQEEQLRQRTVQPYQIVR